MFFNSGGIFITLLEVQDQDNFGDDVKSILVDFWRVVSSFYLLFVIFKVCASDCYTLLLMLIVLIIIKLIILSIANLTLKCVQLIDIYPYYIYWFDVIIIYMNDTQHIWYSLWFDEERQAYNPFEENSYKEQ